MKQIYFYLFFVGADGRNAFVFLTNFTSVEFSGFVFLPNADNQLSDAIEESVNKAVESNHVELEEYNI